jgi:cell division septation protein DedD
MISIRPSSFTDTTDAPPDIATGIEEHEKRLPMVWIPATIIVGLLIAALYLGGRIVKAHSDAKPAVAPLASPVSVQPLIKSEPSPATGEKLAEAKPEPLTPESPKEVTPDDAIPMIAPKDGERYIQVGALNQEATRRFVQRLRDDKLEPHVALGPTPKLMRVLIGPFDNRDALKEKKAQIEGEGMEAFVRQY